MRDLQVLHPNNQITYIRKSLSKIINKERKGEYLGATVQVDSHVTNEIKAFISNDIHDEDFVIWR